MIKDIILVGIGSGIGGICRYLISLAMTQARNGFPWGTFTVNIAGCLLIGILWGVTSRFQNVSPSFSLFLMVGFCGGFTTFSTFSKEGLTMLIWTGGSTPLLCLEGVPDLPVAPQDEAGLTKTFQTWPRGWFHIP